MRRDCKAVGTVLSCAAAWSGTPALGAGKTVMTRAGRLETGVFVSGATEVPACDAPFLDLAGSTVATVPTGQDPDMLTFAPDGCRVRVENEGEPPLELAGRRVPIARFHEHGIARPPVDISVRNLCQEGQYFGEQFVGRLFRNEMPARQRVPTNVMCPGAPDAQHVQ